MTSCQDDQPRPVSETLAPLLNLLLADSTALAIRVAGAHDVWIETAAGAVACHQQVEFADIAWGARLAAEYGDGCLARVLVDGGHHLSVLAGANVDSGISVVLRNVDAHGASHPWGAESGNLSMMTSRQGTPYTFEWHSGEFTGHTLVLAPTGRGMTEGLILGKLNPNPDH